MQPDQTTQPFSVTLPVACGTCWEPLNGANSRESVKVDGTTFWRGGVQYVTYRRVITLVCKECPQPEGEEDPDAA